MARPKRPVWLCTNVFSENYEDKSQEEGYSKGMINKSFCSSTDQKILFPCHGTGHC